MPKIFDYLNEGLECSLQLDPLHYNENSNKPVAKTKNIQNEYSNKFPKFEEIVVIQFIKFVIKVVQIYVTLLLTDAIKRCKSL